MKVIIDKFVRDIEKKLAIKSSTIDSLLNNAITAKIKPSMISEATRIVRSTTISPFENKIIHIQIMPGVIID